jgi:hypothetical protein
MTALTPEQRQEIERTGVVRVEDLETHTVYVILKEEMYQQMQALAAGKSEGPLYESGDFEPSDAYPAIDQTFREGWDDPRMAEYDESS